MVKKRILIVSTAELFPVTMMAQNRIISMIKRLSQDHAIDLLLPEKGNAQEKNYSLINYCNIFYYTHQRNFRIVKKLHYYFIVKLYIRFFFYPRTYYSIKNKNIKNTIIELLDNKKYDIILLHYWHLINIISGINTHNIKIILDTHGLIYQKEILQAKEITNHIYRYFEVIRANKFKSLELKSLNSANHLIFNSIVDSKTYYDIVGKSNFIIIQNGQDINYYNSIVSSENKNTILFYGSMEAKQNIIAFKIFWYKIFPTIKKYNASVKLIILGANPPKWINLLDSGLITVTGYVDDVRPFIIQSSLCIIPLTVGAGFRGRVVEVMAMGVPVVGTHNALDSINMTHSKHGYISDNDREMASYSIKILKNTKLQKELSDNCKRFIKENYSIEATYGKLSKAICDI